MTGEITVFQAFYMLFVAFCGCTGVCFALPLYVYLFFVLRKKLDHLLFNDKYFTEGELIVYHGFYFGFYRPAIYMSGILGLKKAKKKFKGFDFSKVISRRLYWLCFISAYVFGTLAIVGALMALLAYPLGFMEW